MGYYTTFHFEARIKNFEHHEIRSILQGVFDKEYYFDSVPSAPTHSFFRNSRCGEIMWGCTASYPPQLQPRFLKFTGRLIFTCELKDYDDTIKEFIDWVKPAILTPQDLNYIGWVQGEDNKQRRYLHLQKDGVIIEKWG